jgi:Tfp pilus assembly PilM family ATPase
MIENIFLPESFGAFYLFSTKVVGIEINKTHISVCITKKSGYSTRIEELIDEPIETNGTPYTQRVVHALQNIAKKIGTPDTLISVLPSSIVFFKELRVPFFDRDKISLIIGFEIEPLLPFPAKDAYIDFIIMNKTAEQTTLLVAAVQKKYIDEHKELFIQAGITPPSIITVDFLILYDMYRQNSFYRSLAKNALLIDFSTTTVRVGNTQDGELKQIRTVPSGTSTIAKSIAETLHMPIQQVMEQLVRFGINQEPSSNYTKLVLEGLLSISNAIQLIVASFVGAQQPNEQEYVILLFGPGTRIPGIDTFLSEQLKHKCIIVDPNTIIEGTPLRTKKHKIASWALTCTGATIPSPLMSDFNLNKSEQAESFKSFLAPALTFLILLGSLLIILTGHMLWQQYTLRSEIAASSAETLESLKEKFSEIDAEDTDLDEAINSAEATITAREKMWYKFSKEQRLSPLRYLYELTTLLDKKITLDLEQLNINDTLMTLKGKVADGDELTMLERLIGSSPYFRQLPPLRLQDPNFVMKIRLIPGVQRKK